MTQFPNLAYSIENTRLLDKLAIEDLKISGFKLMDRAAAAAFKAVKQHWPDAKSVAVFCGAGNNGGDAYLLAKLCLQEGMQVSVFTIGGKCKTEVAQKAQTEWLSVGDAPKEFNQEIITADLIIDGILGTGLKSKVDKAYTKVIDAINSVNKPILSLDIPSGLDGDTGVSLGPTVKASATITFITIKTGLIQNEGYNHTGKLLFDNLGVPAEVYSKVAASLKCISYESLKPIFPNRKQNCHKGTNGHVCVIGGGSLGFSGAVCLASEAALRSGSGVVSCIIPECSLPLMSRLPAEVMCHAAESADDVSDVLEKIQVIVFGPGLGQSTWSKKIFSKMLTMPHNRIIDADGLNLLAKTPKYCDTWILTPHPREAARLLNISVEEVQADRISSVKQIQSKYGGTIVLKGAGTLIATKDDVVIFPKAVPSLATAGTGDVLSGIIGALLAQGVSTTQAAYIGVVVHSSAGMLEQSLGALGMLASDLFLHIRSLLNPTDTTDIHDELYI
jgi:hydroxyethylthiazole kinase-like uncharacterized protein yjeF